SRRFLSKAEIPADQFEGLVFLEDVMASLTPVAKARMLVTAHLLPARLLARLYSPERRTDSVATVVFSSGSTGTPKGVMLSHRNILADCDAVTQVFHLESSDVMVGVLPFFHSFGYTITLWLPLIEGFGAVFHPNPMDGKAIGELAEKHQ